MKKKALFNFLNGKKTPLKTAVIGGLAVLSTFYLFNPTAGIFELLPDNMPFLGNIDEFTAVMLLLGSLRYFGVDLVEMFSGETSDREDKDPPAEPRYEPPKVNQ
jgi:hypothetical protein